MPIKFFLLTILLAVFLFARLDRIFYKSNDSFCIKQIFPKWSTEPQPDLNYTKAINEILNQPFTYMTKGKQSYVFLSTDRKWVLKFPRLSRRHMKLSFKSFGNLSFLDKIQKDQKIFDLTKEEARIVYTHNHPTTNLGLIQLKDRLGNFHNLPLNGIPFYIQEFGDRFFSASWENTDPRKLIEKTVQLFVKLYEKGVIDKDPIFDVNFGITEGCPFIIDVGQCEVCENLPPKEQYLSEMTNSLGSMLQNKSSDLYQFYKNLLQSNSSQIQ